MTWNIIWFYNCLVIIYYFLTYHHMNHLSNIIITYRTVIDSLLVLKNTIFTLQLCILGWSDRIRWLTRKHGPALALCEPIAREPRVRRMCGLSSNIARLARLYMTGTWLWYLQRQLREANGIYNESLYQTETTNRRVVVLT